jgi:hypothetical protein
MVAEPLKVWPRLNAITSPAAKLKLLTLARLCHALPADVPEFALLPDVAST